VEEGKVIRTDPPAGTPLERGSEVRVFVSTGAGTATVPSVLDLSPEQATSELRGAGFSVERVTRTTLDPDEDGLVIDQSPGGDSEAKPGSTVTIVVGRFVASTTTSTSTTTTTTTTAP